jgi:alkaline phosphatase
MTLSYGNYKFKDFVKTTPCGVPREILVDRVHHHGGHPDGLRRQQQHTAEERAVLSRRRHGPDHPDRGRIYAAGEDGNLTIDTLPESAFVKTYSADAQVTDSAPSMSAYMTGYKMNNEVISMTPDTSAYNKTSFADYVSGADSTCPSSGNGTSVPTLLEIAKTNGLATGVVTTTRITHATPAATYSHICHRDGENAIAAQMVPGGAGYNTALADGVDVILGGGLRHFLPKSSTGGSRTDSRDLVAEMKKAGYNYASNRSEFNALPSSGKLLGLFTSSHMAYDLDRDASKEPSLAEMTSRAIDQLKTNPNGMFLMVEGGRIDHALHETTARKALQDTVAFDTRSRPPSTRCRRWTRA